MSKNKFLLPLILILLVIFLPIGIIGLVKHNNDVRIASNPNHEHKYMGKLYYYDGNRFLGSYTCISADCGDVNTIVEDEYLKVSTGDDRTISNLNNTIALLYDDNDIKLISIAKGEVYKTYYAVKNYGNNNLPFLIVKNALGKYGIISTSTGALITDDDYDYAGYIYNNDASGNFVVSKFSKYYIIGNKTDDVENIKSIKFSNPIYYYDAYWIITSINGNFSVNNYDGQYQKTGIERFEIIGKYIIASIGSNSIYIYGSDGTSQKYENGSYEYKIVDDKIEIYNSGSLLETLS